MGIHTNITNKVLDQSYKKPCRNLKKERTKERNILCVTPHVTIYITPHVT